MLRIGHRGAPGFPRHLENTIWSFRKAVWAGADAIELDVRRSKDKHIVVSHEPVAYLTYDDLCEIGILTFSEALRYLCHLCLLVVEIKERGIIRDIVKILDTHNVRKNVVLSSFDASDNTSVTSTWDELACDSSDIPIALLATTERIKKFGEDSLITAALNLGAFAIHPPHTVLTADFVKRAHDLGLLVHTWVVNDPADIARCKEFGVDGIISDFPERL